jgi:folate-binding protein YgfZ
LEVVVSVRTPLAVAFTGAVTADDGGTLVAGSYGDVEREYLALRREVGVVDRSHHGFVRIDGPEAVKFLHALVSSDIAALRPGQGQRSMLLQPQGKLQVDLRLLRLAPSGEGVTGDSVSGGSGDIVLAETEPGFAEQLVTALNRLRIRVKAEVHDLSGEWASIGVRGPGAQAALVALGAPVPEEQHAHGAWGDVLVVRADWPGVPGFDVVGPLAAVGAAWEQVVAAGAVRAGLWSAEAVRIEAGVARQGRDIDTSTIPQEAFREVDAVSFTKGCFLGQELVCRIDTRGHVNRYLRGVVVRDSVVPPVGAEVVVPDGAGGDKVVGALTSVAESLDRHAPVALAMVRREVEPPVDVTLRWPGGEAAARVEELPLLP